MDFYHKTAGDTALFTNAPPMAEVVLKDISRRVERVIYAEAFKPGAIWWDAEGRKGRRGLSAERMSDYHCAATRSPRPGVVDQLRIEQTIWDLKRAPIKPPVMFVPEQETPEIVITAKPLAAIDWHDGHGNRLSPKPKADEVFTSVFEPQNLDNWIRINTAGRVKFSCALRQRFTGMKIDVAASNTGRVRVGEADHGKVLSERGYLFARRIVPLLDFSGMGSVLIYMFENDDGYLYGKLPLKDGDNGDKVEG
ncbi:hypothetical protein GJ904_17630 [Salmonella enterica]|nr:hypothetical protein [Salmonella enterica subsp. enterica serovar Saintpaul]EEC1302893.1 hypothetical protein [Salmonella enterica]